MTVKQFARCDWCNQQVPVSSRAEADTWLRTHDCPEGHATKDELGREENNDA